MIEMHKDLKKTGKKCLQIMSMLKLEIEWKADCFNDKAKKFIRKS